jgi:hypothetical protein
MLNAEGGSVGTMPIYANQSNNSNFMDTADLVSFLASIVL